MGCDEPEKVASKLRPGEIVGISQKKGVERIF
jgi:hypothetical protein